MIVRAEISASYFCILAPKCFWESTRTTKEAHLNEWVYRVALALPDIYSEYATVMIYLSIATNRRVLQQKISAGVQLFLTIATNHRNIFKK